MAKAPNLILRSLLATGGLLGLAALRYWFASRGGPTRPVQAQLILDAVVITVGGLLGGLLLHWSWPRTRSRIAGALVGGITGLIFSSVAGFALGLWPEWIPLDLAGMTAVAGLLAGALVGALCWPPRGSERLSSADLIVGRDQRHDLR